ncbi:MAG: Smr/MutS family protein [Gammaproteobacteria bacterium]|jgi:DNA-nicking Smr family endonuclease
MINDDEKIWLEAIQNVVPLKSDNKINIKPKQNFPKKIHPSEQQQDAALRFHDNDSEQPEYIFFARGGLQHRLQQQLRTGKIKTEAVLDLHGFTVDEARIAVSEFLTQTHTRCLRAVKIIHGKGQTRGSILRNKVYQWLPQCPFVLACCSAIPSDGGTGAIYVLFSRKP